MIDESCGEDFKKWLADMRRTGVRTQVMHAFNLAAGTGMLPKGPYQRASELGLILRLAFESPRFLRWSTKPRTPMNIEQLATDWIDAIAKMSTSHDKDSYDEGDEAADKLLLPIMKAPVAQVREFYNVLLQKMKTDPRIPFIVWMGYEAWGEAIVKNAPDEGIKRLKVKLAKEIADLVESTAKDQIPKAIARALMWRDEAQLQEVKEALESGAKPQIKGKQSCLFLKVKPKGRNKKEVSVMI